MRHRVSTPQTGPGHRASHRDAAQPGARRCSATSTSRRPCRRRRSCGRSSSGSSRIAKRGLAAGDANGKSLHARRLVLRDIQDRDVVGKLFDTIAPRFEARPGGYTRILRLGYRRGDSAEVAQIELVGSEYNPNAESREDRERREGRSRRASAAGCARRPSACAARRPRARRGAEEGDAEEGQAGAHQDATRREPHRHPRQGRQDLDAAQGRRVANGRQLASLKLSAPEAPSSQSQGRPLRTGSPFGIALRLRSCEFFTLPPPPRARAPPSPRR